MVVPVGLDLNVQPTMLPFAEELAETLDLEDHPDLNVHLTVHLDELGIVFEHLEPAVVEGVHLTVNDDPFKDEPFLTHDIHFAAQQPPRELCEGVSVIEAISTCLFREPYILDVVQLNFAASVVRDH